MDAIQELREEVVTTIGAHAHLENEEGSAMFGNGASLVAQNTHWNKRGEVKTGCRFIVKKADEESIVRVFRVSVYVDVEEVL